MERKTLRRKERQKAQGKGREKDREDREVEMKGSEKKRN